MTATFEGRNMKREQSLLTLICLIGALLLFAFVAYNLFASGNIISTDGLFFTVVPIVIALCFLAVPGQEILMRKLEQRKIARGELVAPSGSAARIPARAGAAPAALRSAPALKDARGRAMPPDVNRMVAEMNRPEGGEQ